MTAEGRENTIEYNDSKYHGRRCNMSAIWRHFVLTRGATKKCWNICVWRDQASIQTGCAKRKARECEYWFPDDMSAYLWAEKAIEEKLSEGYVETGPQRKSFPKPKRKVPSARPRSRVLREWEQIEAWFASQTPDGTVPLPDPATDPRVRRAEASVQATLPADVRRSFAIHDGGGKWRFRFGRLMPLVDVVNWFYARKNVLESGFYDDGDHKGRPRGPIKKCWHNLRWIPICTNDEGDFLFIDLDPAPGGKKGQIIEFTRDDGPKRVVAKGFCEFLASLADDLESGKYKMDKKYWVLKWPLK